MPISRVRWDKRVADDAVNAHEAEQQRHRGGGREQHERQRRPSHGALVKITEGLNSGQR